jgi:farnesyl diphosphate synthase
MPPSAVDWMNKLMDYNVPLGKLVRGLTVIDTARAVNGGALTPDQYKRAAVLGWCIEWLQAFFLVADDIMDESTMRRGQPCWYKHKNVGVIAVNDSFLLESHIYLILKKYFRQESYYTILMEIFHEVTFQTELGQLLDLTSQPADKSIDLTLFTEERYISIVKYKTSFYSFYVPVILGLVVGGVTATPDYETAFQTAKEICTKMGIYFQVQDDVLDCYGDPKIIG